MRLRGALYLTLAASIWGGMYVVTKYVLEFIPPLTLLAMRLAIASLILGAALWWTGGWRVERRHWALLASLGLVGFTLSLGLQFWGTKLSSAHNGGLITSASPAFILLFAVWLLRERLSWPSLLGLGLATLGVVAVIGPEASAGGGPSLGVGNISLVGAAVTWALYTVLSKIATGHYSSLAVTTYATLSGLLFTSPLAWASEWRVSAPDLGGLPTLVWLGVAYVGIVSTAVAFYLWVRGFALLDASTGSLFFFAQPIVAAMLGALLLGEVLHWYFYAGAGLIFAGLAVSAVGSARGDDRGRAAVPEPDRSGDALTGSAGVSGPGAGGPEGA